MTIQEAIQKAIEGGWNIVNIKEDNGYTENFRLVAADPLFWQSLGKAMGWVNIGREPEWSRISDQIAVLLWLPENSWWYYWHRFISHLAKGNTIESYFDHLP